MNARQKKLLAVAVVVAAAADELVGFRILTRRRRLRPAGYPYMGQAGGAGPGQQGSGGKGPGQ